MNHYNDPEIIVKYWVNNNLEEDNNSDKKTEVVEEIWKIVEGTDGVYEVSNFGRVKSHDTIQRRSNGKVICNFHVKGRMLTLNRTGKGRKYYGVSINGKTTKVHRLVAEAFVPNPFNLPVVNHIDGNSLNNRADNLEWTTVKGNIRHAKLHGLCPRGEDSYNAKLTEMDVKRIRKTYIKGDKEYGSKPLARKYNVSSTTIRLIIQKKIWREI